MDHEQQRPEWLTLRELARRLGCREETALEWALSGGLEPEPDGWRVAEVELLLAGEAGKQGVQGGQDPTLN